MKLLLAIEAIVGLSGTALLWWAFDWRVALGVFLLTWSQNIRRTYAP